MRDAVAITSPPEVAGLRGGLNRISDQFAAWLSDGLISVCARVSLAAIFFMSGRTKVDGLLTVSEGAYTLFREEYRVPLAPPELVAHLATYAEHLFPVLLVLGLFTRFSAAALLGMTAVIQIFVYPSAWPTHLSWATIALYLMAKGGGVMSVDRKLGLN